MELTLTLISGIAWTTVYVAAIVIGLRHKTYAMPIAALGLNIAWEWIYAVHDLMFDPQIQAYVNLTWAIGDVIILYTFFRYGRKELPPFVTKPLFIGWGLAVLGTSFALQFLFIAEFGMEGMLAAQYSAFLQNLLMSGLFIAMFIARRGARGQSLVIAVAKWLGTLAPTILFGVMGNSPFILGIGLLCSVFDLIYIGLLMWAKARPQHFAPAVPASE